MLVSKHGSLSRRILFELRLSGRRSRNFHHFDARLDSFFPRYHLLVSFERELTSLKLAISQFQRLLCRAHDRAAAEAESF